MNAPHHIESDSLVAPHGGALIDRIVAPDAVAALRAEAETLPAVTMDARETADLELIATGAASPLTGFLTRADYVPVLSSMRLASGVVWPLPFTLAVAAAPSASSLALRDASGRLWGALRVRDVFTRDPVDEARAVYGVTDTIHPGVAYLLDRPTTLVGGEVDVLPLPTDLPFSERRLTPRALRAVIRERGWRRVAGFQTRNPIHRAHEHLTKIALEVSDGLVIHPLVGETKADDVPAAVRMRAYEALLSRYYPQDRVVLSVFPAAMRYAGPREAVLHALVRKNYGITQLIIGRDHAGVGKFFPPLAAQQIFATFAPGEIGVQPLMLDATFFCRACDGLASARTCPHDAAERLELSGSRVRELLMQGASLPSEFTRPEVAEVLRDHYGGAAAGARPTGARGAIIWFTGLSGAGKSTLAGHLHDRLVAGGRAVEVLDGDEVRTHLSKGLGFSKADRDTNIGRIAYVARRLAQHGVVAITAAISPYADARLDARRRAEATGLAFVEVFAQASLDALVERDVKGLYKKAIAGEIGQFTGVSDPYEAPETPDIVAYTDRESVDESMRRIWAHLTARGIA